MQFGYVPPRQAIAENLLINPRGLINQANEADGVIAAGDYFCDGWKAGPAGCEVYRLAGGGFDLRSGTIKQLIPNNLEASRVIRTNFDVVTGSPVIKVNGTVDQAQAGSGEYIEIEISGDNSQFNRIVAADSQVKPVYQQSSDELSPCFKFYHAMDGTNPAVKGMFGTVSYAGHDGSMRIPYFTRMHKLPAVSFVMDAGTTLDNLFIGLDGAWLVVYHNSSFGTTGRILKAIVDARP